jgi:hypothetical protein
VLDKRFPIMKWRRLPMERTEECEDQLATGAPVDRMGRGLATPMMIKPLMVCLFLPPEPGWGHDRVQAQQAEAYSRGVSGRGPGGTPGAVDKSQAGLDGHAKGGHCHLRLFFGQAVISPCKIGPGCEGEGHSQTPPKRGAEFPFLKKGRRCRH